MPSASNDPAVQPPEHAPELSLAPDLPVTAAASRALELGLGAIKFYEPRALRGEIEGIHQFRVAVRRLRAAVELFAPVLHGSRVRFYRTELPLVGHCAGAARDADVLQQLIRADSAALEPAIARALIPTLQALADTRSAALREMTRFLQSKRYARLCERLAPALTHKFPPDVTVRQLAPKLVRSIIRASLRAGSRLTPESPPTAFHRLRVHLKRLRYALEMLDQLSGRRTAKAVKRLRRMQDELGVHQDLVNTGAWIRQLARAQHQAETLLAAGALLQFISERRVKIAARALRQWKKIEHSRILNKALDEIAEFAQISGTPTPDQS